VAVNDFGSCELPHEIIRHSIVIQHWGRVHDLTGSSCYALKVGIADACGCVCFGGLGLLRATEGETAARPTRW
jgi:hypothetical protein